MIIWSHLNRPCLLRSGVFLERWTRFTHEYSIRARECACLRVYKLWVCVCVCVCVLITLLSLFLLHRTSVSCISRMRKLASSWAAEGKSFCFRLRRGNASSDPAFPLRGPSTAGSRYERSPCCILRCAERREKRRFVTVSLRNDNYRWFFLFLFLPLHPCQYTWSFLLQARLYWFTSSDLIFSVVNYIRLFYSPRFPVGCH